MWKTIYSCLYLPQTCSSLDVPTYCLSSRITSKRILIYEKRVRYLARCKDVVWKRWSTEYRRGLRERHNMKHNQRQLSSSKGDVVIIKGEERTCGQWKLGIVEELFPGRDGVVRSVRLRAGKSYLERPIQHLYPLELSCDRTADVPNRTLNPQAPVFRSTRDAAVAAGVRIQSQAEDEQCS